MGLMLPHRTIIYTIRYDVPSTQPDQLDQYWPLRVSKSNLAEYCSTREPFPRPAGIIVNKNKIRRLLAS